jgi:hypothetical protein
MAKIDVSVYTTRGHTYDIMPIPPIPEHCHEIPAGPILFVLESRLLNEETVGPAITDGPVLEDGGTSLHVCDAADGLEHLRFDCFEKAPHYHYVRNAEQRNQVVQIDDIAIDPVDWTLQCVRTRLPEMLDYAGAGELAAAVRADRQAVERGIELVEKKIGELG